MLTDVIVKEVVAAALRRFGKPSWRARPEIDLSGSQKGIENHLRFAASWTSQISMRDQPMSRALEQVFVKQRFSTVRVGGEPSRVLPQRLLESGHNIVVLGHPGAGKTTLVKYLCQHLLTTDAQGADRFECPLLFRLREVPRESGLIQHILESLNLRVNIQWLDVDKRIHDYDRAERERVLALLRESVLVEFLEAHPAVLLLDGLDETPPDAISAVERDIGRLANNLSRSIFMLTCRIGSLQIPVDNAQQLFICPLEPEDISEFSIKWFRSEDVARKFLAAVSTTPYRDTISRPLTLAQLCILYDAYRELPDQPSLIYQRIINLLLEEWDRQRDVTRVSKYGQFGPERKRQFLAAMAWELSARGSGHSYGHSELGAAYERARVRFGLPAEAQGAVLEEIESHTGLLVRAGYKHEFSHKSLQEVLCADHISRTPDLHGQTSRLSSLPNECAIATVVSADSNAFFHLMCEAFLSPQFWVPYLTRLVVEGAEFQNDWSMGVDVLRVLSLAWPAGTEERDPAADALEEATEELLRQARLDEPVRLAMRRFVFLSRDNRVVRLRQQVRHDESAVAPILILSSKFQHAAWFAPQA